MMITENLNAQQIEILDAYRAHKGGISVDQRILLDGARHARALGDHATAEQFRDQAKGLQRLRVEAERILFANHHHAAETED